MAFVYLLSRELRPDHCPHKGPFLAIKGEYSITQERIELSVANPQSKVIKLSSQQGLNIRGVNGRNEIVPNHRFLEGGSVGFVQEGNILGEPTGLDFFHHLYCAT